LGAQRWEPPLITRRGIVSPALTSADSTRGLRGTIGNPAFVRLPAEVERCIFELRDEGNSLRRIALILDADGVPTAQGAERWGHQTVATVIKRANRKQ
jgi:recombinase